MLRYAMFVFILFTLIGCQSSQDQDKGKSDNTEKRVIVYKYDKYSAKQISRMQYSKLLRIGISYYKNKQNQFAFPFLEAAVRSEKGKAYYYLGNVSMNLRLYNKAAKAYQNSSYKNYRNKDSIFNLACAYSLWQKPEFSMLALLANFRNGHKSMIRINKDPDLEFFRKSKYYKQYLSNRKFFSKGITPKTRADFMDNMLFDKYYLEPEALSSSTGCKFKRDGLFFFVLPQGGRGSIGSWEIDEQAKVMILKIEKEWGIYDAPVHAKFNSIKTIADFKNANFTNMITYRIPFKNIYLKIKDMNIYFHGAMSGKYEKIVIGNSKTDGISLNFGQSLSW